MAQLETNKVLVRYLGCHLERHFETIFFAKFFYTYCSENEGQ